MDNAHETSDRTLSTDDARTNGDHNFGDRLANRIVGSFLFQYVKSSATHGSQLLRARTAQYVKARWLVFFLLLGWHLYYNLFVYQGFHIILYGLGIHLLHQGAQFWNPINEMHSSRSLGDNDDEGSRTTATARSLAPSISSPRRKRLPEYIIWFSCSRGLAINFVLTRFRIFDIPVFWPILLGYLLLLGVVILGQTVVGRRAVNAAMAHEDDSDTDAVVVRLKLMLNQSICNIVSISPWNAIKQVPPSWKNAISPTSWRAFLEDMDRAMSCDDASRNRLHVSNGVLLASSMFGLVVFNCLWGSSCFPMCHTMATAAVRDDCERNVFLLMLCCMIPALVSARCHMKTHQAELGFGAERVRQICAELQLLNPYIKLEVTQKRGLLVVEARVVHVAAAKNKRLDDKEYPTVEKSKVPNPDAGVTAPLLEVLTV